LKESNPVLKKLGFVTLAALIVSLRLRKAENSGTDSSGKTEGDANGLKTVQVHGLGLLTKKVYRGKGPLVKQPKQHSITQVFGIHVHRLNAAVERPALSTPTVNIVAVGRHAFPGATSNIKPGESVNARRRLVLALLAVNSVGRQSSLGHGGSGDELEPSMPGFGGVVKPLGPLLKVTLKAGEKVTVDFDNYKQLLLFLFLFLL
jgi:hypothetical protein